MMNTNNTTKRASLTARQVYLALIAYANNEPVEVSPANLIEWANTKLEQLDKRSSAPRKPTAKQLANEDYKREILDVLRENGDYMNIREIQAASETLSELSNQAISSLLRYLGQNEVGTGEVEKIIDKRIAMYRAVDTTAE